MASNEGAANGGSVADELLKEMKRVRAFLAKTSAMYESEKERLDKQMDIFIGLALPEMLKKSVADEKISTEVREKLASLLGFMLQCTAEVTGDVDGTGKAMKNWVAEGNLDGEDEQSLFSDDSTPRLAKLFDGIKECVDEILMMLEVKKGEEENGKRKKKVKMDQKDPDNI